MRFIRQMDVELRLPDDWMDRVATATTAVSDKIRRAALAAKNEGLSGDKFTDAVHRALHKAIAESSGLWGGAKDALASVSYDKCWYCECKQDRSDMHVDHFRPKNRITGVKGHPGYWWLAFDWRNFRLACTFCNCVREDLERQEVGGKGNKFPIVEPPPRMRRASSPLDRPRLLDPIMLQDVKLLRFRPNGVPEPASKDAESEEFKRADETISVFNLRHTRLKRAREAVGIQLRQEIDFANLAYTAGDMTNFEIFGERIIGMVRNDAPYSAFARSILASHRDLEWVDEIWKFI
jgi:uncharacterized protein (TIGR02646 family)